MKNQNLLLELLKHGRSPIGVDSQALSSIPDHLKSSSLESKHFQNSNHKHSSTLVP